MAGAGEDGQEGAVSGSSALPAPGQPVQSSLPLRRLGRASKTTPSRPRVRREFPPGHSTLGGRSEPERLACRIDHKNRCWRQGRGLPRDRDQPKAYGRHQGVARGGGDRWRAVGALPARSRSARPAQSSEHRCHLRSGEERRHGGPRHGAGRGGDAGGPHRAGTHSCR